MPRSGASRAGRTKAIPLIRALRSLLLAVLLAAPLAAAPARAGELAVAAAANLKYAVDELVAAFGEERPDVEVKVTYGASGNFYAQLSQRAPFDLFLSADAVYPARLVEAGLALDDAMFRYATGRLALWIPPGSALPVGSLGLAALRDPRVRRIAIANPRHAPYGAAAIEALTAAGLHDELKDRLVLGENVGQAAQFVQSRAADAGFIALSLALSPPLAGGTHHVVPAELHAPLEQAGVILERARDPAAARAFRDFLLGKRGRAILGRFGYGP
jgi:molybdate transport system substrate-binding protein